MCGHVCGAAVSRVMVLQPTPGLSLHLLNSEGTCGENALPAGTLVPDLSVSRLCLWANHLISLGTAFLVSTMGR